MLINTLQELSEHLELGKPIICFDYGSKKIGIALSTPDHRMCMPHSIINETQTTQQISKSSNIALDNRACAIIVGLPLNMNGTLNEQSEITKKFAEKLTEHTNLPVYMQDERMTSKTADSLLKSIGMNRKARNAKDDAIAANLILETTLNLLTNLSSKF